jgi:hypothetical protein
MPRQITPSTTLDTLRREAKRWLRALRDGALEARGRLERALPTPPAIPTLRDVQHAIAREFGLSGWPALKERVASDAPLRRYERVAEALVTAYQTPDETAIRIVWGYFGHMRAWDAMRRYVRLDLGKTERPQPGEVDTITIDEARLLVARGQGFRDWEALAAFARAIPAGKTTVVPKAVPMYAAATDGEPAIAARSHDWDEVMALMQERQLPGLHAAGQMTDDVLGRLARIESITALDLSGSKALTDDGLRVLARLPRLTRLHLGGCRITDRGLDVLRRLPALETINLAWTGVTDAGAAHLAGCERLRSVDLSGSSCGDGALRALTNKPQLSEVRSGNNVTDAGLPLLHEFPVFTRWHGGDEHMGLTSPDARPNFLMLRGPFTNAGMTHLVGLDGLFALNIDDRYLAITGAGLAPLAALPHLAWLAFDAVDESMSYIAALPHLRFLMCQDTAAGDDGFVALSRSRSIEHIWGRRCYNLRSRGFAALADMPALRHLSVSCKNVDDAGLAALPRFPALRELMPMDVPDEGYRYVGRCSGLESLVLMYCRDTGDHATEHITALPRLQKYFASYNRVTDRTPQLLSGMSTLESITFDTCAALTDAGIATLARLPRLEALSLSGMPHVTANVVSAFGPGVRVSWTP